MWRCGRCRLKSKQAKASPAHPLLLCPRQRLTLGWAARLQPEAVRNVHVYNEACRRIVQCQGFYSWENTMSKAEGGKGLLPFMTLGCTLHRWGNQRRSSYKTGSWKQKLGGSRGVLFAVLPCGLPSRLSYSAQLTSPGETLTHIRLAFPTPITKKMHSTVGEIWSLEISSSKTTPGCVKGTNTSQHTQ